MRPGTPGCRGGAAPGAGRARREPVDREGLPDVEAVLRSVGGVAAAQHAIGQANTPQQISPAAGEPVPVRPETCRLKNLFPCRIECHESGMEEDLRRLCRLPARSESVVSLHRSDLRQFHAVPKTLTQVFAVRLRCTPGPWTRTASGPIFNDCVGYVARPATRPRFPGETRLRRTRKSGR